MTPGEGSAGDGGPAETVERVTGTGVPVRGNDIDTDQIIPARFLKAITFDGLGEYAFFDQRFDSEDDVAPENSDAVDVNDHPFNESRYREASIMVVNANFGCGSSREHAPQALLRWGIDAIVGESFAEIFAGNCLALGVPTVTADHETIERLQDWVEANPDTELAVAIDEETVTYGGHTVGVDVDDAQRRALVEGVWDTTALMKSNRQAVAETAARLPYTDV